MGVQNDKLSQWQKLPFSFRRSTIDCRQDSFYIQKQYYNAIIRQYPQAQIDTIAGAGRGRHADKTYIRLAKTPSFSR